MDDENLKKRYSHKAVHLMFPVKKKIPSLAHAPTIAQPGKQSTEYFEQ